ADAGGRPSARGRACPAPVLAPPPADMLRRLAAGLAPALLAPAGVGAAELRLDWAGGGTDEDPGAWTIRLTGVAPDAEGRWAVDGGSPYPYGAGETRVPVPAALGAHHLALRGPGTPALDDRSEA